VHFFYACLVFFWHVCFLKRASAIGVVAKR
jgi:hypothetical protein